jgi:hypothetical protein
MNGDMISRTMVGQDFAVGHLDVKSASERSDGIGSGVDPSEGMVRLGP